MTGESGYAHIMHANCWKYAFLRTRYHDGGALPRCGNGLLSAVKGILCAVNKCALVPSHQRLNTASVMPQE